MHAEHFVLEGHCKQALHVVHWECAVHCVQAVKWMQAVHCAQEVHAVHRV